MWNIDDDDFRLEKARTKALQAMKGAGFVDFKDYDATLAENISNQLEILLQRYPKLKDMKWMSTAQLRNDSFKKRLLEENIVHIINTQQLPDTTTVRRYLENKLEPQIKQLINEVSPNTFAESTDKGWGEQQGICFNSLWSNDYNQLASAYKKTVQQKESPEGSHDPLCIFTHEFGHQIDFYLIENNLRGEIDQLWDDAIVRYNSDNNYFEDNLCRYAMLNSNEFLAEGFAEYIHNPKPRELATKIGNAIDMAMK